MFLSTMPAQETALLQFYFPLEPKRAQWNNKQHMHRCQLREPASYTMLAKHHRHLMKILQECVFYFNFRNE